MPGTNALTNTQAKNGKIVLFILTIFVVASIALVSVLANPSTAEAASWHKSGEKLTNGKATIYSTSKMSSNGSDMIHTVYKRDAPGKNAKKLFSTKISFVESFYLHGYSNGNVFYSTGMGAAVSRQLKVFKSSTKTTKRISGVGANYQTSGKYLIGMAAPNNVGARSLRCVNMSTCKVKKIASKAFDCKIRNGKLYFLKGTSYKKSDGSYSIGIYKCKLNGKSQKSISKKVRGYYAAFGSKARTALVLSTSDPRSVTLKY